MPSWISTRRSSSNIRTCFIASSHSHRSATTRWRHSARNKISSVFPPSACSRTKRFRPPTRRSSTTSSARQDGEFNQSAFLPLSQRTTGEIFCPLCVRAHKQSICGGPAITTNWKIESLCLSHAASHAITFSWHEMRIHFVFCVHFDFSFNELLIDETPNMMSNHNSTRPNESSGEDDDDDEEDVEGKKQNGGDVNNKTLLVSLLKQINMLHETNSKIFRNLHETKGKWVRCVHWRLLFLSNAWRIVCANN